MATIILNNGQVRTVDPLQAIKIDFMKRGLKQGTPRQEAFVRLVRAVQFDQTGLQNNYRPPYKDN